MSDRTLALSAWLDKALGHHTIGETLGDASFRRYFRIQANNQCYIAMDAPPEKENCESFIKVAKSFKGLQLPVPKIYDSNIQEGFVLLEDFGDDQLYKVLDDNNFKTLYTQAMEYLYVLQTCKTFNGKKIPAFDRAFQQKELDNFAEWFLYRHLNMKLTYTEKVTIDITLDFLLTKIAKQPQVCIHRDYHSKNLMRLQNNTIGILDFQDAMIGGITYDLVSLLRDCYIDWPVTDIYQLATQFYHGLLSKKLLDDNVSEEQFLYWFDLTGLQRHLKAIFIFSRKYLRDNDSGYLKYISRTLNYTRYVCKKYEELHDFHTLLENRIVPAWEKAS